MLSVNTGVPTSSSWICGKCEIYGRSEQAARARTAYDVIFIAEAAPCEIEVMQTWLLVLKMT